MSSSSCLLTSILQTWDLESLYSFVQQDLIPYVRNHIHAYPPPTHIDVSALDLYILEEASCSVEFAFYLVFMGIYLFPEYMFASRLFQGESRSTCDKLHIESIRMFTIYLEGQRLDPPPLASNVDDDEQHLDDDNIQPRTNVNIFTLVVRLAVHWLQC